MKADEVSNRACNNCTSGSTTVSKKQETRMNIADNIMMVVAFSTNEGEMDLWSNSMFFFPFTVAATDLKTINNEVVLIPPPVELGEPPMKIATKIKIMVDICIKLISNTLNPDVRQVTT